MTRRTTVPLVLAALVSFAGSPGLAADPARVCKDLDRPSCVERMEKEFKARATFGVLLLPVRQQRAPGDAHLRLNVVDGGAAAKAGIVNGARLTGWNGMPLNEDVAQQAFGTPEARHPEAGKKVVLRVEQEGETREIEVVAEAPTQEAVDWRLARVVLEHYGREDYQRFLEERQLSLSDRPTP